MTMYRASFITKISVDVDISAGDEDEAADLAWVEAQRYLETLVGDGRHVTAAYASLDGVGAEAIEEVAA